jgi:uncharacterized sulfatase
MAKQRAKRLSRRAFIQRGMGASVFLSAWGSSCTTLSRDKRQPNVVFILTDDQAYWTINALGFPDAYTPNQDRLVAEGATFSNAFVPTPVCSPNRASLITSRYGTEVGITDWISPTGGKFTRDEAHLGLDPNLPTWVRDLADAGYDTALIGKWHLGTDERFHPTHFGYRHFTGFRGGGTAVQNPTLEHNGKDEQFEGFTVDVLTDAAIQYIRDTDRAQPFLLSLHYREPHAPWMPVADEDWARFKDKPITIPEPNFPDLDIERVTRLTREYLASVAGVDRNLGRLLQTLDQLNLSNDTVVIFTGDNGYNIGHHGVVHKGNASWITGAARDIPGNDPRVARPNMFETSIRVPLLVRWPKAVKPGLRISRTVTTLDWYLTLLAMCDAAAPKGAVLRGRSFLPLLSGAATNWDNDMYGEYSQHHYTEADLRMYRTPEWKLVRDFKNQGKDELYHLKTDPGERANLIADESCRSVRDSLSKKMRARMETVGDPLTKRT